MKNNHYQQWKEQKIAVTIPGDFADNVMNQVRRTKRTLPTHSFLTSLLSRPFTRAAILTLGVLGGLIRLGSAIAIILGSCLEAKGALPW